MGLTNAIAILRRQDAKLKVEVPASQHHKAYSYYKEGHEPSTPNPSGKRKGRGGAIAAGIGGAIAGGALTAGILAMRRGKAGEEPIEPKGSLKANNDIDADSREVSNGIKGSSSSRLLGGESRKKPLITPPPMSNSDRVLVTPAPRKSLKEMVKEGVGDGSPSKQNAGLAKPKSLKDMVQEGVKAPSTSKQNAQIVTEKSENLLTKGVKALRKFSNKNHSEQGVQAKPKKSLSDMVKEGVTTPSLSKQNASFSIDPDVGSSATTPKRKGLLDKGIAAIRKMTKEGIDRDRKAGGAFAEREVDLNKVAHTAGQKSRIAAQNLTTFAKAYSETFGKKQPKAVDVKSTEVHESLPEGKTVPKQSTSKKQSKKKSPTAAEKRAIQKQIDDIDK
ncbi:hypothetical protein [Pseudanabaena sp. 'Roaring Creek']|uniref:hypothetical protein n=1 Tax=Pseudanabaena sp. 'Roaring Creek' TaxID=1681830 RepID=UPI0006D77427|nr:hypothetical protein [Pseudanabaena sp. 'Roaring Creek']